MLGRRAARNFGTGNISNHFICVWTLHDQTPNPCALATLFPQGVVSNPSLFRDRTGAVRLMAQHRALARQSSRIASYAVLAAGDRCESCSFYIWVGGRAHSKPSGQYLAVAVSHERPGEPFDLLAMPALALCLLWIRCRLGRPQSLFPACDAAHM